MPNRIIKESIHTSDTVAEMTDLQFRVWMALMTYVDDYGRGDARPAIIKGACFPLIERITPKAIKTALDGLIKLGCVRLYRVDRKEYLYFPTWEEHQRVRNKVSKFPAPPEAGENAADESEEEAESDNSQQVAADCGELSQDAARARAESESRIQNPNDRDIYTHAHETTAEKKFIPPTAVEVYLYCKERGSSVDPNAFWDFYDAADWKDSNGNLIQNWKQRVIAWEKNAEVRR